jgi:hypothetical protein
MRRSLLLLSLCAAAALVRPAAGQTRDNTVEPGMTKAEVIDHLGPPQSVKNSDSLTFMFYQNGCERTCGMHDVVTLANGKVVDAIFRDPKRHYTGESSSPNSISAAEAIKIGAAKKANPDSGRAAPPVVLPPLKQNPTPPPPPPPAAAPDTTKKDTTAAKPPAA